MKEYMVKHVGYPEGYEWIADRSILSKFIEEYINLVAKDGWRIHSWNVSGIIGYFSVFLFERDVDNEDFGDSEPKTDEISPILAMDRAVGTDLSTAIRDTMK